MADARATRSRLAAVAALAISATCSDRGELRPPIPAEVDLVAVLSFDGDGALLTSTGLLDAAVATTVEAPSGGARTFLVGYRRGAIEALGAGTAAERASSPLRIATACEEQLPAPLWAAELFEDGGLTPAARPALTAAWLAGVCPEPPSGPATVDPRCLVRRGTAEISRRGECGLDVALDLDSARATVHARVQRDGSICASVERGGTLTACSSGHTYTSSIVLSCTEKDAGECELELHAAAPELGAREVRSLKLLGDLPPVTPYSRGLVEHGVTSDLVLTDRHAIVVSTDGPARLSTLKCDPPNLTTRLTWIDLDSLEIIRTATAPSCMRRIALDPLATNPGGFLGTRALIEAPEPAFALTRFDAFGRAIRTTTISGLPALHQNAHYWDFGILALAPPERIVVAIASDGARAQGVEPATLVDVLMSFDVDSLAPRETSGRLMLIGTRGLVQAGPNLIAAAADLTNCVVLFTGTLERGPHIDCQSHAGDLAGLHLHTGSRTFLVIDRDATPGLQLFSFDRYERDSVYFERSAMPTAISRWPLDDRLVAVAVLTPVELVPETEAYLARFDPARGRFVPGSLKLGRGGVSHLRVDAKGRLWALLPWTAEVVRLTF